MILRKPYAFLIKHFRMIHFIILGLMGFIFYKSIRMLTFINSRTKGKEYIDYSQISNSYVNTFLIIAILLVIIICGILIYLLKYKKKPIVFYIMVISTYFASLVLFLITKSYIYNMRFTKLNVTTNGLVRDGFFILIALQVPFIIYTIIRTIGFDIRKFDFHSDVADMDVSSEDDEEFAFQIEVDRNDVETKARKRYRYLKYYYLENRTVLHIIIGIAGVITVGLIVNYFMSAERIYRQGEKFSIDKIDITVLDTYKTSKNVLGETLSEKNFYVVARVKIQNNYPYMTPFNEGLVQLNYTDVKSSKIYDTDKDLLLEFGLPYNKQALEPGETGLFTFIFKVPMDYFNNEFKMKVNYAIDYKDGRYIDRYRTVTLDPKTDRNKLKEIATKNMGEELVFKGSYLGNTKLVIESCKIASSFPYKIFQCTDNKCTDNNYQFNSPTTNNATTLVRLKYKLTYDKTVLDSRYFVKDFITRFSRMSFEYHGKTHSPTILYSEEQLPSNDYLFLSTHDRIKDAENIVLDFNIRGNGYKYKLECSK